MAGTDPPAGPQRTCIGCRRRTDPQELVRVVGTPEGGLATGRTLPGRGAWICPDPACVTAATRKRAWSRALRRPVAAGAADPLLEAFRRPEGVEPPV